jgi:hypothetical protein
MNVNESAAATITYGLSHHMGQLKVDPARLTWRVGHPTHDGETWLDWRVWDTDRMTALAHLETAIVSDTVSTITPDSGQYGTPGYVPARYGKLTGSYDLADTTAYQGVVLHHPMVAWRMVREDGTILFDSLTQASSYWRVVRSGVPMEWGEAVRQAVARGELPHRILDRGYQIRYT